MVASPDGLVVVCFGLPRRASVSLDIQLSYVVVAVVVVVVVVMVVLLLLLLMLLLLLLH